MYSRGMAADIVVFGPHPDDIEIGLGGSIAGHSDDGYAVGLCDLTLGELSSNGTPEQRRREADAATRVLGAAWRENLAWADGGITPTPDLINSAVDVIVRAPSPSRTGTIGIPTTARRARCSASRRSGAAFDATRQAKRHGAPTGSATTSSTTRRRRRS